MQDAIHPFKVYNSIFFSIFTELATKTPIDFRTFSSSTKQFCSPFTVTLHFPNFSILPKPKLLLIYFLFVSTFFFVKNGYLFILREREREREREHEWKRGRQRGRKSIPSKLHAVSMEPNTGLNPTDEETMT